MRRSFVLDREESLISQDFQNTTDDAMTKLFNDPEFREIVTKKMVELGIGKENT